MGRMLALGSREYRIVGVIDQWKPIPRFYDLSYNIYGKSEDVFLPFSRAVETQMSPGNTSCDHTPEAGWAGRLRSECVWIEFWVELPTASDAANYHNWLNEYSAEQQRLGRFDWPPNIRLNNVRRWLYLHHVVSNEVRILILVSFSFLIVCLLNTIGLMLAKTVARAGDIGLRRALGASRRAIFAQCVIEVGVIGILGGLLGLTFTAIGLLSLRRLLSANTVELTHLDFTDVSIALLLAVAATVIAGLYPTWRATQIQPGWQLKAQ